MPEKNLFGKSFMEDSCSHQGLGTGYRTFRLKDASVPSSCVSSLASSSLLEWPGDLFHVFFMCVQVRVGLVVQDRSGSASRMKHICQMFVYRACNYGLGIKDLFRWVQCFWEVIHFGMNITIIQAFGRLVLATVPQAALGLCGNHSIFWVSAYDGDDVPWLASQASLHLTSRGGYQVLTG
ncbi:hypothetical protein NPIL_441341 [Nephila pilipes]|uniref:Uncharacterized protein n=1 Tax=Nephila pilipes TaxID=299642 RepID=A0A8X6QGL3_NEPPI|nr:hypothetical protein NPIL_441341 [Nephila pilipes]